MGKQRKCFLKAFIQQFRIDLQRAFHFHLLFTAIRARKLHPHSCFARGVGDCRPGGQLCPPSWYSSLAESGCDSTERSKGLVRDQASLKGKSIKKIRDSPNAHTPNLLPHTSQKAFHCKTGQKVQTAMSLLPFIPTPQN